MRLGAYEVTAELGRGSGGVVYRVRGPTGTDLALKLLPRKYGRDHARLVRELELMRSLGERSGFVPLVDAGVCPEGPFVVMPLLEGGTLRQRLARERPTPQAVAELGITLAHTIGRAHARAIVHRDLKPENILFDGDGLAYIADLGIAKALTSDATPLGDLSRTGEVRGTPGYMPLEQLHDAKRAGPEADVFAIGAILYELLTGTAPFLGATLMETIDALERGQLIPISKTRPDVPRDVAAAIERALAPDPEDRYPDGETFARALEAAVSRRRASPLAVGLGVAAIAGWLFCIVLILYIKAKTEPGGQSSPPPPSSPTTGTTPRPAASPRRPSPVATPTPTPAPPATKLTLGRVLGSAAFHTISEPTALAVTPDGKIAVVGDAGGQLRWTDVATGAELQAHIYGVEPILALACFADDKRTIVLARGKDPSVVTASTGHQTSLTGHPAEVVAVAAAPLGGLAATGDRKGTIMVWDLDSKKNVLTVSCDHAITKLEFASDARAIFAGLESGTVATIQLDPPKQLRAAMERGKPITALAVALEGDRIATAAEGLFPRIATLDQTQYSQLDDQPNVRSIAFGGGGRLFTASSDGKIGSYDLGVARPGIVTSGGSQRFPAIAAVHSTTRALYLSAPAGLPRFFGEPPPPGHDREVTALLPLPGGRLLSGGADPGLRFWDTANALETAVRAEHTDGLTEIAASADGQHIYTASRDGTIADRDAQTGDRLESIPSPLGVVAALAIDSHGRVWIGGARGIGLLRGTASIGGSAATASLVAVPGGRLVAWDAAGELSCRDPDQGAVVWRRDLRPPESRRALASDGSLVVTLENDGALRGMHVADGVEVWSSPTASGSHPRSIALSSDGRRLLVGGDDVALVDAASGAVLTRVAIPSRFDSVPVVAFGTDGVAAFAGTARGLILELALAP